MFFAVIYLMLFNPRTETNSYIILGIAGAYELLINKNKTAVTLILGIWLTVRVIKTPRGQSPLFVERSTR